MITTDDTNAPKVNETGNVPTHKQKKTEHTAGQQKGFKPLAQGERKPMKIGWGSRAKTLTLGKDDSSGYCKPQTEAKGHDMKSLSTFENGTITGRSNLIRMKLQMRLGQPSIDGVGGRSSEYNTAIHGFDLLEGSPDELSDIVGCRVNVTAGSCDNSAMITGCTVAEKVDGVTCSLSDFCSKFMQMGRVDTAVPANQHLFTRLQSMFRNAVNDNDYFQILFNGCVTVLRAAIAHHLGLRGQYSHNVRVAVYDYRHMPLGYDPLGENIIWIGEADGTDYAMFVASIFRGGDTVVYQERTRACGLMTAPVGLADTNEWIALCSNGTQPAMPVEAPSFMTCPMECQLYLEHFAASRNLSGELWEVMNMVLAMACEDVDIRLEVPCNELRPSMEVFGFVFDKNMARPGQLSQVKINTNYLVRRRAIQMASNARLLDHVCFSDWVTTESREVRANRQANRMRESIQTSAAVFRNIAKVAGLPEAAWRARYLYATPEVAVRRLMVSGAEYSAWGLLGTASGNGMFQKMLRGLRWDPRMSFGSGHDMGELEWQSMIEVFECRPLRGTAVGSAADFERRSWMDPGQVVWLQAVEISATAGEVSRPVHLPPARGKVTISGPEMYAQAKAAAESRLKHNKDMKAVKSKEPAAAIRVRTPSETASSLLSAEPVDRPLMGHLGASNASSPRERLSSVPSIEDVLDLADEQLEVITSEEDKAMRAREEEVAMELIARIDPSVEASPRLSGAEPFARRFATKEEATDSAKTEDDSADVGQVDDNLADGVQENCVVAGPITIAQEEPQTPVEDSKPEKVVVLGGKEPIPFRSIKSVVVSQSRLEVRGRKGVPLLSLDRNLKTGYYSTKVRFQHCVQGLRSDLKLQGGAIECEGDPFTHRRFRVGAFTIWKYNGVWRVHHATLYAEDEQTIRGRALTAKQPVVDVVNDDKPVRDRVHIVGSVLYIPRTRKASDSQICGNVIGGRVPQIESSEKYTRQYPQNGPPCWCHSINLVDRGHKIDLSGSGPSKSEASADARRKLEAKVKRF